MTTNTRDADAPEVLEIRVRGHLDDRWADWIDELEIVHEAGGTSVLRAPMADQAALHGALARLRDLGIPIVSVCHAGTNESAAGQMRAIVQRAYGSAETLALRSVERPAIGEHDVLVRMHAAGIDAGVWHLMAGLPYVVRLGFGLRRPKHAIPGMDLAGHVEAVGPAVTRFRPGDAVFGSANGVFAEYVAVPEDRLAAKPEQVTWQQAAATGNSGAAALKALTEVADVQPGERVLVIGASGGVGSFAVQIAKALGADVTGVASTAKLDLVRALGADDVIDYTREQITARGVRYDVIVDTGGRRPLRVLRRALAPEGRLVIVGGEGGGRWLGGADRQLRATLLSAFTRQRLGTLISTARAPELERLSALMASGRVVPAIDRSFPLAETADAIRYYESRRARGKVVVEA